MTIDEVSQALKGQLKPAERLKLEIEYHLSSDDKTRSRAGKDRMKASTHGEDLLTPLVERMETDILTTIKK